VRRSRGVDRAHPAAGVAFAFAGTPADVGRATCSQQDDAGHVRSVPRARPGVPSSSMEESAMYDRCNSTRPAAPGLLAGDDTGGAGGPSRRQFLKSGAGIAAGGGVAQMLLTGDAPAEGSGTGNS